jgi:prepilin-type N-terminal cleavage/methylation domain-containing protein
MCARSSERGKAASARGRACRGFTLPELLVVLVVVGLLAAVAMPKFDAGLALRNDGWHDEVVSALRQARQTAVSHRRLVCAVVGSTSVTLTIAAANPATACGAALPGPDGAAAYTSTSVTTATLTPAGTLYFQPSGRVTSDGAGATASDRSIAIGGSTAISVVGETGHVE